MVHTQSLISLRAVFFMTVPSKPYRADGAEATACEPFKPVALSNAGKF